MRLVTGDTKEQIQQKWEQWLKKRYYQQYLDTDQTFADFQQLKGTPQYADNFAVAHGGEVVVYRAIQPITGFTRLYLVDSRDPESRVKLAEDGKPGYDSLHFYDRPVVALTHDRIATIARKGPTDALYIRSYRRIEETVKTGTGDREGPVKVRFKLGRAKLIFDPKPDQIVEMGSPSFSPDGTQVAFVGLTAGGTTDVFVVDLDSKEVSRLTHDDYAEKELDWGPGGIAFVSDATEHGKFNLFIIDPDNGKSRRLGWSDESQRYPAWTPDGKALTYSADGQGKWDIYKLAMVDAKQSPSPANGEDEGNEVIAKDTGKATDQDSPERLTDFPTGLMQARIVGKKLMAMGLRSGQMRLFAAEVDGLTPAEGTEQQPRDYATWAIPQRDLPGSTDYTPFSWRSWRLEDAFAVLSSSAYGSGFLLFQDRMRDRTAYVNFQIFGAPELTSAQVAYLDRKRRTGWGSVLPG
jgi:hypothetical protein